MNDRLRVANHHCPGCGTSQEHFARYPWYFCQACLKLAHDVDGRGLSFFNLSLSGGLGWSYSDRSELAMMRDVSRIACLINQRQVIVTEARFGGIVCQPFVGDRSFKKDKYFLDLSCAYDRDELLARMVKL